jgi:hypothetical protein
MKKRTINLKAYEELKSLEVEECEECHCLTGEDWEYVDFTNKTVVQCPQCGTKIYLDAIREDLEENKYCTTNNETYCEKPTSKNRPFCHGQFEDLNLFCKKTCRHMISCRRKTEHNSKLCYQNYIKKLSNKE